MAHAPLKIDYFTDVLCVWAWIAQRRIDQLCQDWSGQVEVHHHYLNLFGNTEIRIGEGWAERGGYAGVVY